MKFPSGIFKLTNHGELLPETIDTHGLKIVECTLDYMGRLYTTTYRCGLNETQSVVFTVDRQWNVLYTEVVSRECEYWSQPSRSDYLSF
jgi:hypothetical protein